MKIFLLVVGPVVVLFFRPESERRGESNAQPASSSSSHRSIGGHRSPTTAQHPLRTMFAATVRTATRSVARRQAPLLVRGFAAKSDGGESNKALADAISKPTMPFGMGKWLGLETDNLVPTDKERNTKPKHIPDFVPDDVKKEMKEMGLDGIEDLDEMEARHIEGYNDLGLVPPEGTGTFASPILIPSRRGSRVVGYEDPESHAMMWFTIHNDENTYYIKDLGLFFKMLHVPSEDSGHH